MNKFKKTMMLLVIIAVVFGAFGAKAARAFNLVDLSDLETEFFSNLNRGLGEDLSQLAAQAGHRINGVQVAAACRIFIDANSRLGEQGAYTVNEIMDHPENYSSMLSGTGLNEQCPNWVNLEIPEKAQVIALLLTAMAHFESRCQETVPNHSAPNGTARGLFQLHEGREGDYDGTTNACERNSSMNANESIDCALAMLNIQFSRSGLLFDRRSYWEVLRPQGASQTTGLIGQAISNSRLCQVR